MNIFTLQMSVNIWIAQSSTDLIPQAPRPPLQGLCCNSSSPKWKVQTLFFNISKSSDGNIDNDRYVMSYIIEKVEMYLECVSFSKFYSHRANLLFVLLEALQGWALTDWELKAAHKVISLMSFKPKTKLSRSWEARTRPSPIHWKFEELLAQKNCINSEMWKVENNIKSEGEKTVKQNLDLFIQCLTDGHLHHYDWQITILWVHCTSLQSALVKPIRHSPHNALAIAPTFCLLTNLAGQLDYHISR